MIKTTLTQTFITCTTASLIAGGARAASFTSSSAGFFLEDSAPADGSLDNWDTNPAAPTSGNSDTWIVDLNMSGENGTATWHGGTTQLDSGEINLKNNSNFTIQDLVLNGGQLEGDQGNMTLNVNGTMTINTGTYTGRGNKTAHLTLNATDYAGSGTFTVIDNRNSTLTFASGDFSGFTGSFVVENGSPTSVGNIPALGFSYSIANATFSIELVEGLHGGTDPIYGNYKFFDGTDVKVTALTIGGAGIGAGTYTMADLIALDAGYANHLIDEGGATGTITIVPEPASLALLGLGGLIILRRRRG